MAEHSFEDILSKAREGNDSAFEKIVEMKKEKVFWIAYRIVGDTEEAKEVTQKTMIKLWKIIKKYNSEYKFDTWLFRIVTNLAIDQHRHLKRFKAFSLEDTETGFSALAGKNENDDSAMDMEKIFQHVTAVLTEKQKAIFILSVIEGLSSEQIAEILELSSSTVRNHLAQAREKLRREMNNRFPEYSLGRI